MKDQVSVKYIALDCYGSALQFTGSGRSGQCEIDVADQFETNVAASNALKFAEEKGGRVEQFGGAK